VRGARGAGSRRAGCGEAGYRCHGSRVSRARMRGPGSTGRWPGCGSHGRAGPHLPPTQGWGRGAHGAGSPGTSPGGQHGSAARVPGSRCEAPWRRVPRAARAFWRDAASSCRLQVSVSLPGPGPAPPCGPARPCSQPGCVGGCGRRAAGLSGGPRNILRAQADSGPGPPDLGPEVPRRHPSLL
jgi:hypothetical protein